MLTQWQRCYPNVHLTHRYSLNSPPVPWRSCQVHCRWRQFSWWRPASGLSQRTFATGDEPPPVWYPGNAEQCADFPIGWSSSCTPTPSLENQTAQFRTMEQELVPVAKSAACWCAFFYIIIIIMCIYCAFINALNTHRIHINLNMIFYTHVAHSPIKNNLHKVLYVNTHIHTLWL